METINYTLTARGIVAEGELEQVAGGARRVMLVRSKKSEGRQVGGDNVIDLAAWKAHREEVRWLQTDGEEAAWKADDQLEPDEVLDTAPSRRERRTHTALLTGEILATLSVIAVAAALVMRIILF